MTMRVEVAGIRAKILQDIGQGGQGLARLVELEDMPGTKMVLKELSLRPDTEARLRWLCDQNLSRLTPAVAAPICCEVSGRHTILHLAPLVEGVGQQEDLLPRGFPQNLELCLELACLIQLLEEQGLAHGDLAPSNLLITPEGHLHLIDFDGFLAFDPDVAPPDTIGQRPMLAPEQRDGSHQNPTRESGYFAMAIMMSLILTGHYPTDGIASDPASVDRALACGHWPEKDRPFDPADLPITALGPALTALFDRAFSLDPKARPGPNEWRRALTKALQNCWIHDCGQAFVFEPGLTACPGCHAAITPPAQAPTTDVIKITLSGLGRSFKTEIKNGTPIILGRATMVGSPGTISNRHLTILPYGDQLLFRHTGSNPTLLKRDGQWYQLSEIWLSKNQLQSGVTLMLADQPVTLTLA